MGDVVNLRLVRKRRRRADEAERAAENRALHGRTATQKQQDRNASESLARHLEGHRLEPAEKRDPQEA